MVSSAWSIDPCKAGRRSVGNLTLDITQWQRPDPAGPRRVSADSDVKMHALPLATLRWTFQVSKI